MINRSASAMNIDLHISAANSVAIICFSGWSSGNANSATRIIFGILKSGMLTVNKELIRVKHVHAQKMRIRSKNSKQKKKLTFQKKIFLFAQSWIFAFGTDFRIWNRTQEVWFRNQRSSAKARSLLGAVG